MLCLAVDRQSTETVEDNEDYLGIVFLYQVLDEFLHDHEYYCKGEKLFKQRAYSQVVFEENLVLNYT